MRRSAGRVPWKTLIVLALLAGAGAWYFSAGRATEVVKYKSAQVLRGDIRASVISTGEVAPENRLEIKPPIAGRIDEVLVNEGERVEKGQILAWMSSSERAALLDAARAGGEGELKRWQAFFKPTPVLAPISGSIIVRKVEPGQSFTTQEAVLVMADRLTVKAQVDETDIAEIHNGQSASIVLDAYPEHAVQASVVKIAFDATSVNNVTTYIVDVLPAEIPAFMRSGMTANVEFSLGEKKSVLTLPLEMLKTKDGKTFVLLPPVQPQAAPEERAVKTGLSDSTRTEILEGLAEGQAVISFDKAASGAPKAGNPFSPFGRGKH